MLKCDNCSREAQYTTADPGVNPAHYCTYCLPHWLRERAEAGHFPLMSPLETQKSTKKKTAASKKSDADEDN